MRRHGGMWRVMALGFLIAGGQAAAAEAGGEAPARSGCRDSGVSVRFAARSSELDSGARGALNGVATWLKMAEGRTIHLRSDTANKRLAEERAAAMKNYLLGRGVEPEQILSASADDAEVRSSGAGRASVTVLTCEGTEATAAR